MNSILSLSDIKTATVRELQVFIFKNLSYSNNLVLHSCPKRWQIDRLGGSSSDDDEENVHFAFGHALGVGLQTLFVPGKSKNDAYLAAFMAWDIPIDAELPKKKKSFWYVLRAIDVAYHLVYELRAEGWEIAQFKDLPAFEYSFQIVLPNGYRYNAHIDLILWHPELQKYKVIEIKSSGFNQPHEAVYGNSSQALSYSIALDYLVQHQTSYDVLYLVYSCPSMEWLQFPFSKSHLVKVEWIREILYDCATIDNLIETNYFPKRGEACFNFMQPCPYYGGCGYADQYLGVEQREILERNAAKEIENTRIDKNNKRGYDVIINLEDLVADKMIQLTEMIPTS